MPSSYSEFSSFFESIEGADAVVLTPNKRLTRLIQKRYAEFQQKSGKSAWQALPCYALNTWYQVLWEHHACALIESDGGNAPSLLGAEQEKALWAEIVDTNEDESIELFNTAATASVAKNAWTSLVQYDCWPEVNESLNPLLQRWIARYNEETSTKNVCDFSSMVKQLICQIEAGLIPLPKKLVLYAFDDIPIQLEILIKILQQQGSFVESAFVMRPAQTIARVCATELSEEINLAARWAKQTIRKNPTAKVGVIIPQLGTMREKVENTFIDIFEKDYFLPGSVRHATGFNISAAVPLGQCPPIQAAIAALRLNLNELDLLQLAQIVSSPYLASESELGARSQLLLEIKSTCKKLSPTALRARVGEKLCISDVEPTADGDSSDRTMPVFYQCLQDLNHHTLTASKLAYPSKWAEVFQNQLVNMNWPGDRSPDTLEYQQVQLWSEVLSKFCQFDGLFGEVKVAKAIRLLDNIVQDMPFQAQTMDSSVQVLGLLEGAGLNFDALWVLGLDNRVWPAPISPNALLPLALQKQKKMPMANVEKELSLAKKLTERFSQAADHLIFSYSRADGDRQLRPSEFIEAYPLIDIAELNLSENHDNYESVFKSHAQESLVDNQGSQLQTPLHVKGGSQILKDQSSCAFKAYARYRLLAVAPRKLQSGIESFERGNLIHIALEKIWKEIKDHQSLLSLSEVELEGVLLQSINIALAQLEKRRPLGQKIKDVERSRLLVLLNHWMAIEKQRAPFTVALNEEQKSIILSGMEIQVRFDRVDELEDGTYFVIDYKTSKLSVNQWMGERPDEPQIPIYALAQKNNVGGVAYGQISSDEIAYKGISEAEGLADGVKTIDKVRGNELPDSWQALLESWERVINNLASAYLNGDAAVDPKSLNKSCTYCDLHGMCRIAEVQEENKSPLNKSHTSHSSKEKSQ